MPEKADPDEPEVEEGSQINRRRFVQALGTAGGAGALGSIGSDTASAERSVGLTHEEEKNAKRVMQSYNSNTAANKAITKYGDNLINELSEQNFLNSPRNSKLQSDHLIEKPTESSEGIHVSAFNFDGEYSARIVSKKKTETHSVKIFIHPQAEKHYAVAESLNDESDVTILEDSDGEVVTKQNCYRADDNICKIGDTYCTGNSEYKKMRCPNYPVSCYAGDFIECCGYTNFC